MVIVTAVFYILDKLGKSKFIWGITICYLLFCFYSYGKGTVNYIEEGYETARQTLCAEYKEIPGIYVTTGDHLVINDCLFLAQQERTYPLRKEQLAELPQILTGVLEDSLILYVNIYYDERQVAESVAKLTDYQSIDLLYDNTYTQIFVLSRK